MGVSACLSIRLSRYLLSPNDTGSTISSTGSRYSSAIRFTKSCTRPLALSALTSHQLVISSTLLFYVIDTTGPEIRPEALIRSWTSVRKSALASSRSSNTACTWYHCTTITSPIRSTRTIQIPSSVILPRHARSIDVDGLFVPEANSEVTYHRAYSV